MIVKLYLIADEYADKGFKVIAVDVADEWHIAYYDKHHTAIALQEVDIIMPKVSQLVAMGMNKIDLMKDELTENINNCNQRIKDFESKFMMLESTSE